MTNSNVLKAYLFISGLLLTFIGGSTLIMPVQMKASAGIDLGGNISIINDVRAFAALILTFAVLAILGAFIKRLTYTSTLVSFLLFTALGLGRLLSIFLDGSPVDGLIKATGLELILGLLGLILFSIYKKKD